MPQWVNSKQKLPHEVGRYFVKIDGRRDILSLQQIEKDSNYYDELLWLDEKDDAKKFTEQISQVKSIDDFVKLKFFDANNFIAKNKPKVVHNDFNKKETAINTIHSIVELNRINFNQIKSLEILFGVKFKKFKK
jgi:hypothetical protein